MGSDVQGELYPARSPEIVEPETLNDPAPTRGAGQGTRRLEASALLVIGACAAVCGALIIRATWLSLQAWPISSNGFSYLIWLSSPAPAESLEPRIAPMLLRAMFGWLPLSPIGKFNAVVLCAWLAAALGFVLLFWRRAPAVSCVGAAAWAVWLPTFGFAYEYPRECLGCGLVMIGCALLRRPHVVRLFGAACASTGCLLHSSSAFLCAFLLLGGVPLCVRRGDRRTLTRLLLFVSWCSVGIYVGIRGAEHLMKGAELQDWFAWDRMEASGTISGLEALQLRTVFLVLILALLGTVVLKFMRERGMENESPLGATLVALLCMLPLWAPREGYLQRAMYTGMPWSWLAVGSATVLAGTSFLPPREGGLRLPVTKLGVLLLFSLALFAPGQSPWRVDGRSPSVEELVSYRDRLARIVRREEMLTAPYGTHFALAYLLGRPVQARAGDVMMPNALHFTCRRSERAEVRETHAVGGRCFIVRT